MNFLSTFMLAVAITASATTTFAETYDGVQPIASSRARADVRQEAVTAARSGNAFAEDAGFGVAAPQISSVDRASVRREAVATARALNQNLDPRSFYNSTIPHQFGG